MPKMSEISCLLSFFLVARIIVLMFLLVSFFVCVSWFGAEFYFRFSCRSVLEWSLVVIAWFWELLVLCGRWCHGVFNLTVAFLKWC